MKIQITVPAEIRRLLGLKSGDKILFFQKPSGEVVINNASAQAIYKDQKAYWIAMAVSAVMRLGDAGRSMVHLLLVFILPMYIYVIGFYNSVESHGFSDAEAMGTDIEKP